MKNKKESSKIVSIQENDVLLDVTNTRYPKRNIKKVNYEEENIPDDGYIYCDRCEREYEGNIFCPIHGPLINYINTEVPKDKKNPMRAMQTLPVDYLCIRQSGIPNAGMGVWTIQKIPIGVRFGPYEGIESVRGNEDGYCWQIQKNGHKLCVDGKKQGLSNWLRYVNCSRNVVEQNLMAFQYLGKIYYRTIKNIYPGTELLIYYGDEYGKRLGIDTKNYNTPLDIRQLPANNFPCMICNLKFTNPVFLESHRRQCLIFDADVNNNNINKTNIEDQNQKEKQANENISNAKTKHSLNNCKKYKKIINLETLNNVKIENKNQFNWDKCDYTTKHKSNLNKHVKGGVHLNVKRFKCIQCNSKFTFRSSLIRHMVEVHLNDKLFKCSQCKSKLIKRSDLKTHLSKFKVHLNVLLLHKCS